MRTANPRVPWRHAPDAVFLLGALIVLVLLGGVGLAGSAFPASDAARHGVAPPSRAAAAPGVVPASIAPRPSHPLAAISLSAPGVDPTGISLSWTPSGSFTFSSYTVQYSTAGSTGPWQSAGVIINAGTTTFGVKGLTPGGEYWWRILENDGILGNQYSNVIAVNQSTLAYLSATVLTATNVQLNWTNNASYGGSLGFESYQVYESVGGSAPGVAATITSELTLSTTITGLSSGASYQFFLNTTDCLSGCGTGGPNLTGSESNSVTTGTPLPLSATVSATRSAVDVGQLDLFTCTPSGGQSPYKITWDFGNGTFVSGPGAVAQSFVTPGPITVTCKVTDALASQSTSATTVTVLVDPQVSVNASRTQAEPGQSITFNCTPSLGLSPYSVDWTFGDGGSAATGLTVHSYVAMGNFTATCAATDSTGTSVSDHLTLTVYPTLTATLQPNASAAAPSSNLTFAALPSKGSGVYVAYNWSFADGSSTNGSAPSVSHAFGAAGNYSVSVLVTDTLGGSVSATTLVHISVLTVTLGSVPTQAWVGNRVDFSASASGGAGAPYTFTWHFGDAAGQTGATVNHSYAKTGSFTPSVTVTDRLGASRTVTLAVLSISTPPSPAPFFSAWLLLLLAILVAVGVAVALELRHRRQADRQYSAVAGRVPAADPSRLVRGRRVCRMCGHPNLAIRETCEACGASLRRTPSQ
ncbi:MAG TPA: PKD domain-containing protein [Thermoplasmata archaeon]|nr:PKD domain-containing protein [Thermoplasmata archaeon]